ncbi:type 1 glutamine amidotransferase [Synechococcus sp. PCC 6312]|uniref:type 1 glutamine amidotransferase n=1 Tax=Synechococcus sp. (strain ATCC 27167 / PCC 6312) TaxID=195253 RepID=UPI00029ED936|nr:type 1 glutamine amidotransferase [Synechococcus sp. PCC 6312]AFY61631.1 GMP synthase family protein [Synechococcus sp. PCC 6312]
MNRNSLRILLLQARNDPPTQQEELAEFSRYSGLRPDQFTVLNGFDQAEFPPTVIHSHHALFIGGSSDASVLKPDLYPFVPPSQALILYCLEQRIPVFASCFGFQLAVEALGGRVILDREHMEMGTYPIYLTPNAEADPLCQTLPAEFLAISGHQERAVSLPPEAIHLAYSQLCPYHGFTLPEQPFYAFQFHPEVNRADLIARISRYCERYFEHPDSLQDLANSAQETPIANQLIATFVDRILLKSPQLTR